MRQPSASVAILWDDIGAAESKATEVAFVRARIDNRAELIAELGLGDDAPDDELLAALYRKYHHGCADRLLGDFAFAICDHARGAIYLARDIMGCQPIYYSCNDQGLFLSDTIAALHERAEVSTEEDLPFLAASLSYAFAHFERTAFAHIRKVPPAHYMIARQGTCSVRRYWNPRAVKRRHWSSHEQCLTEFRDLLRQAIRDRLPSDGAVGVHVSGGLDCSSIAILAANELKAAGRPSPVPYSWYPPPRAELDEIAKEEYERLEAVFAAMNAEPVYSEQSAKNVLAVLAQDHRIRPICNASYNERPVLEHAQNSGVRVIMTGFGGDETASFDGRGFTHELALQGKWLALKPFAKLSGQSWLRYCINQTLFGLAHAFLPDRMLNRLQYGLTGKGYSKLGILRRLLSSNQANHGEVLVSNSATTAYQTRDYRSDEFVQNVDPLPPIPAVRCTTSKAARCNLLDWAGLISRLEGWDAQAADYGVKHVYPLLDRRIVEFTLSLPGEVFRDQEWKRLFFRQAMDPVLPPEVCWREVKADPARIDPLIAVMETAFAQIAKAIGEGEYAGPDSKRVDLARLARDIGAIGVKNRKRLGRLMQAIEYLGSGPVLSNRVGGSDLHRRPFSD